MPLRAPAGRPVPPAGAAPRRLLPCLVVALACAAVAATAQEIVPETPAPAPQWPWRWQWPFAAKATAPAAAPSTPAAPPASSVAGVAPPPAAAVASGVSGSARAEPAAAPPRARPVAGAAADEPSWSMLTAAQRSALEPLAREWASIDGDRKRKWLEIAGRMPRMSPAQQARMQARMTEWAHMTPQERGQARLHFQEARQVAPRDRKESWDAYMALPAEQRRQLAERAAGIAPPTAGRSPPAAARRGGQADAAAGDGVQAKSNIVAGPGPTPTKVIAPTIVRAASGATTVLMSRRPAPPAHQQAGMPKIIAIPGFVDSATLLPQRGAQGAAVRPVAASEPAASRR